MYSYIFFLQPLRNKVDLHSHKYDFLKTLVNSRLAHLNWNKEYTDISKTHLFSYVQVLTSSIISHSTLIILMWEYLTS